MFPPAVGGLGNLGHWEGSGHLARGVEEKSNLRGRMERDLQ